MGKRDFAECPFNKKNCATCTCVNGKVYCTALEDPYDDYCKFYKEKGEADRQKKRCKTLAKYRGYYSPKDNYEYKPQTETKYTKDGNIIVNQSWRRRINKEYGI